MQAPTHPRRVRFGAFEADLRSGELRKHGIRIKLQDQPFQVLAMLLKHPGEMVPREELRLRLWPADTFVDFDAGLNNAIKRLREALGDSAENPRFVETVPRHGYRFIAPVEDGSQAFGHYRILEKIGEGGMGVVYCARDERLNRQVALKVLPAGSVADEKARERLIREAQIASALNHPHICTIYEVGEADGQVYVAMELVEGRALSELTQTGGLPPEVVMRYGAQIADALNHAHHRGVAHRDLKCSNVFITPEGRAKVLDFGLAKRLPGEQWEEVTRSQLSLDEAGTVVGTLPYMAPEVLRGEPASTRSDLWSLGVMLHEMATGARPFRGSTGFELSSAILRESPALPANLPAGLRAVIERCLEKDPEQRYQRASEVKAALDALFPASAVLPEAPPRPPRRTLARIWPATAAVALLALLAFAVLTNVGGWRERLFGSAPAPRIAVLPFENLTGDAAQEYLVDGITDELITNLANIASLEVRSRTSAMRYKGARKPPLREIARELRVAILLEGSVRIEGNRLRVNVQLIDADHDRHLWARLYERDFSGIPTLPGELTQAIAEEIGAKLTPQERTRLASERPANPEAHLLYLKGRYYFFRATSGSPEFYEKSRVAYQQAIDADPTYASAYAGLSGYYALAADSGLLAPHEAWPKARAAAGKALEIDPKVGHLNLANVYLFYEWNWPAYEAEIKRVLELHPGAVEPYHQQAIYLRTMNRFEEAIASVRKAEQLDPLSRSIAVSAGWTYYYARRYDQAIEQFRRILTLDKESMDAHFGLAKSYEHKGMEKETIAQWETLLDLSGRPEVARSLQQTYAASGYRKALKRTFETQLHGLQEAAKERYVSPVNFATLYALLGDKDQAFRWLEIAFADRSSKLLDLKLDADFDSLRSDARFADLAKRVGLP